LRFTKRPPTYDRVELNITAMIDVCLFLLVFFMVNLHFYPVEGDFDITMPASMASEGMPTDTETPPIKVQLRADENGNLNGIRMGQRSLMSLRQLQNQIREIISLERGPAGVAADAEVEFDCDYKLKYEYVIAAITAISGYVAEDKRSIVHMVSKIKFSPPKAPPE
jgi:biopolymer transport protein ExbD